MYATKPNISQPELAKQSFLIKTGGCKLKENKRVEPGVNSVQLIVQY